MVTVCIPIYNFDISQLAKALQSQDVDAEYEVIFIDDASDIQYREVNKSCVEKLEFTFIQLSENKGRAAIRNLFVEYAAHDYLIFLDCDSLIYSSSFVAQYIQSISQGHNVICGGRIYASQYPGIEKKLRWQYGKEKESKSLKERKLKPFLSFMTNNFCIRKSVLCEVQFDERITQYGHEDTLFGYQLKGLAIPIHHIDNAVENGDIESNTVFLSKTEDGLLSLYQICCFLQDKRFVNHVTLLKTFAALRAWGADRWLLYPLGFLSDWLKNRFTKGKVSLILFDLYKLIVLAKIWNGSTNNSSSSHIE